MHIPKQLPQFKELNVLFIVASRQNARFFVVGDGMVEERDSFSVEKSRYSDKEGRLGVRGARSGKGARNMFRSGIPVENIKERVKDDFLREFEKQFNIIWKDDFDALYLFVSPSVVNEIPSRLTKQQREKIRQTVEGNYLKIHPLDLLKKLNI